MLLFLGCVVTLTSAFNLPNKSPDVSSRLASISTVAKPAQQRRTLTLADRVAYQRAIEEVYWRHRIWPKENAESKPTLDAIVSQRQIEQQVEAYLHKSQIVTDQRGWPITASELQAEMERMASHTKLPQVLRELFEALGNDPFVIAECLARPALAERLLAYPAVEQVKQTSQTFSHIVAAATGYILPTILDTAGGCVDDSWTATSTTNAPSARGGHTAVWTGSEMIIWGGSDFSGLTNTGGRYNPSTDSWTATSTISVPTARTLHHAVWTGTEMIVWGGYDPDNPPFYLITGGRYSPTSDTWTTTSTANAPSGRVADTAVWTGSEMIVWGGYNNVAILNTGGKYNPGTNSWTATSTTNAPSARDLHTAVWTGSEMIVWGGEDNSSYFNTGGRYNPSTDSWTTTSTSNAPYGRIDHTAVWTGSEMIVWGGYNGIYPNTGWRYNPNTDSWTATSTTNAPSARVYHSAVWTGSEMIVWGGQVYPMFYNTGGRYNPNTDSWIATSTTNAPSGRVNHAAVWTGNEMIVWGGGGNGTFNTGGRYCAQPSTPIVQSGVSRKTHGAAGVFDVTLPLSGTAGIECRSGGATNDYTIVATFLANVSVTGNPQAAVTSGIGTIGTGGVSNGGRVTIAENVVTVPLTNVTNAQTINVTLFGVNGSTNVVIPMSILVGDTNANGTVNASDVSQTKSQVGMAVSSSNFREDVNASGTISSTDVAIVKSDVGTSLPP